MAAYSTDPVFVVRDTDIYADAECYVFADYEVAKEFARVRFGADEDELRAFVSEEPILGRDFVEDARKQYAR